MRVLRPRFLLVLGFGAALASCSSSTPSSAADAAAQPVADASTTTDVGASPDVSADAAPTDVATTPDAPSTDASAGCAAATTHIAQVVCASEAFLATLTAAQRTTAVLAWTDTVARTRWSNLPGQRRNGLTFGSLSADSRAAALALAHVVLTDAGYSDMTGVFAADDYLGTMSGGGMYSSSNYYIAFLGAPSATGDWMLQIGGHHMAYNLTFRAGVASPTPNHLGAEPKTSFTLNGAMYTPLADEGAAILAPFTALDATQLGAAYLSGQVFADVLLGPDEYETGSYSAVVFPSGAGRTGVRVSTLAAAQQALVTNAIGQWVRDYAPAISDPLMAEYTSAAAYADTFLAWGGTQSAGVNPDVNGTYLRIDGPRVWIEVSCQGGVVIRGQTHYHTIYRDKTRDYGGSLSM